MVTTLAAALSTDSLVGGNGITVLGLYLASLIVIGIFGRFAQKANTLSDFFLGGRNLGFFVLLLTLYATQYSGNTLIGFSANGYRTGFRFFSSITFMMGIVGVYLVFGPKLQILSRKKNFITLGDYIQHRFKNRMLTLFISGSGVIALCAFLVTNLKAIGEVTREVTGGAISPEMGIFLLAITIIIYETLGGLRSVAWTDVIQGLMLFFGCTIIFAVVIVSFGGLDTVGQRLQEIRPEFWQVPPTHQLMTWTSTLIMVSLGIAVYPQAVQRIYAAKNTQTLKWALVVMVFMPLITTFLMVSLGILTNIPYPELSRAQSEGATVLMLQSVVDIYPAMAWVVVLFVGAVLAAIMSTADSALLSIASAITSDWFRPFKPDWDEARLTRFGKGCSWLIMGVAAFLATRLPQSIWGLTQMKLELLVQTAPALLLGLHWRQLKAQSVLVGFLAGTVLTLFLFWAPMISEVLVKRPFGVHGGVWGLIANLVVLVLWQRYMNRKPTK